MFRFCILRFLNRFERFQDHPELIVATGARFEMLFRAFLDRGYQVVANSRSFKPGAAVDVLAIAGGIADPRVAEQVIGGAVEKFGRVDTLVNNAGMFIAKPFTEYFAAKISLNLAGFFHISQRALPMPLPFRWRTRYHNPYGRISPRTIFNTSLS